MQNISDKLIVALDIDTLEEVKDIVSELYPLVQMFKIGAAFPIFYLNDAIQFIGRKGGRVFLDYKYNDIPNTVYSAVATSTSSSIAIMTVKNVSPSSPQISHPVFMMTVYTEGGLQMLQAAARAAEQKATELGIKKPYIVGVTVLTSQAEKRDMLNLVLERATLAKEAGLDGVVCSVHEAKAIREKFGPDFIIVTPGIRTKDAPPDDQKRVATAQEAFDAGANYIVVGRPIVKSKDKKKAVKELLG